MTLHFRCIERAFDEVDELRRPARMEPHHKGLRRYRESLVIEVRGDDPLIFSGIFNDAEPLAISLSDFNQGSRSGSDGALTNLIDIRHPDLQHDGHASLRTHTQHEHRISDSHLGVEPPRSRVRAFGLDSVEYIFQEVQVTFIGRQQIRRQCTETLTKHNTLFTHRYFPFQIGPKALFEFRGPKIA